MKTTRRTGPYVECGLWMRRIVLGSLVSLAAGAVLFVVGLALMGAAAGTVALVAGVVMLIAGLVLRLVIVGDRLWRFLVDLPPRIYSVNAPSAYTCPECGYLLRGVAGPFCPECGTVRPAPREDEDGGGAW